MVYPDLTHKVTVYGPKQSYNEGEGTKWGTAFRGLLQRRLAFWNTTYEECLGMATPDMQWLQKAADAVVQDAVTFDMHETMQHVLVSVLMLLHAKAQALVEPPNRPLHMSRTHVMALLEVLRRHVLTVHPYTLQRARSQSLSVATTQLATDTLSLLGAAWNSVNPDGVHQLNA